MKVLVIDDEKPTLSMFNLFLTAYGYEVYTAEDGESGLSVFEDIRPGIVFTDIRMPGIDGLEVLRRIREQKTGAQVIIITGHGDLEKAVEALDLDASDFINKPVEREALDSALTRAETRSSMPYGQPFTCDAAPDGNLLSIRASGKLSGSSRDMTDDLLAADVWNGPSAAVFHFDEGFSIDRSGINLMMELLGTIRNKGISLTLKGLSYNYIRFFKMVGMEKLANLEH